MSCLYYHPGNRLASHGFRPYCKTTNLFLEQPAVCYDTTMKQHNAFLLVTKIIAILIVLAYAIGLFRTYDTLQASAMLIVAILIGIDLVFTAKQATKNH